MNVPSLSRYPLESDEPAGRTADTDRRSLSTRLLIHGVVWGFAALMMFTAAVGFTGGQIFWLLQGGWD